MTTREFSDYFKTTLFGVFLVVFPLFYGNFSHIFRNEIIYCGTLFLLCAFVIAGLTRNLLTNTVAVGIAGQARNDVRLLDAAIIAFLLCGILNIIFIKNNEIDRFILYKWAAVAGCYFVVKHLNNKQILLYFFVLSGVAQSIIAFLQKAGILASNNMMFAVSGSFGNPGQLGGYLAVCAVVSICLLINSIKSKNKLSACLLTVGVIIQFLGLYFADSRAALVGLMLGMVVFFIPTIKKHKQLFFSIIAISMIVVGVVLYSYRPASANGRLLIWRVSTEMIADKPFFGHGIGAFSEKYMLYQANYFSENPNSVFVPVADNVAFPFNELLNVTIQQGIVGLLLLLAIFYFAFRSKGSWIFKAALAALLVFSMFSYPAEVFPILLLFAVCLGALGTQMTQITRIFADKNKLKPVLFVCIGLIACYFSIKNIVFLDNVSKNISNHEYYEKMQYNRTYHDYYMDWLIEQPISEHSKRIENILPSCENYCLLAEYFSAKKNHEQAETTLRSAIDMIPTRIRPKYQLWQLYVETENVPAAREMAQKIIDTPVKVESIYTLKIKAQLKKHPQ